MFFLVFFLEMEKLNGVYKKEKKEKARQPTLMQINGAILLTLLKIKGISFFFEWHLKGVTAMLPLRVCARRPVFVCVCACVGVTTISPIFSPWESHRFFFYLFRF